MPGGGVDIQPEHVNVRTGDRRAHGAKGIASPGFTLCAMLYALGP